MNSASSPVGISWVSGFEPPPHLQPQVRWLFFFFLLLLLIRNVSMLSEYYTLLFKIKRIWQGMKQCRLTTVLRTLEAIHHFSLLTWKDSKPKLFLTIMSLFQCYIGIFKDLIWKCFPEWWWKHIIDFNLILPLSSISIFSDE